MKGSKGARLLPVEPENLLEAGIATVRERLTSETRELGLDGTAELLGATVDGVVFAVPPVPHWSNDDEKQTVFRVVRLLCAELRVVQLVVITEAWCARYDPDVDIGGEGLVRPVDRPDRTEVIALAYSDVYGRKVSWTYEILRDGEGRCTGLAEPIKSEGDGGNLFSFLPNVLGSHAAN